MILSQKALKRALYEKEQEMSDRDLFCSREYADYLTQMSRGILQHPNISSSVQEQGKESVAYSDGSVNVINFNNDYIQNAPERVQKHYKIVGLNLHETGHGLFTDFELLKTVLGKIVHDGECFPAAREETSYQDELEDFLANSGEAGRHTIVHLFKDVDNCIEDGFVDRAVVAVAPGYRSCLKEVSREDLKTFPAYSEMKKKKLKDELIFLNLILAYSRHGIRLYKEADESDELIQAFREVEPTIREAVREASPLRRKRCVWKVFCRLFHFVKERDEQNQQQQQGGQDGQQDAGQQQQPSGQQQQGGRQQKNSQSSSASPSLEEVLKKLQKEAEKHGEKADHSDQNGTGNKKAMERVEKEMKKEKGEENESAPTSPLPSSSSELEALAKKAARNEVEREQEREISKQAANLLRGVQKESSFHDNVPFEIYRQNIREGARRFYEDSHKECEAIVNRILKEFEKEIKDRQLGDTLTGLYSGKRIVANQIHRSDKKIMSRKIMPEDIPDMAIGIMVDMSGSMGGERIDAAIKCCYITYLFCKRLDIPVFIYGHYTLGSEVVLYNVVDENSLTEDNAMRIFSMQPGGCNRDGFALRFCLKKLEKITAQEKILFVISDGQPNHNGYDAYCGKIDIQEAVWQALKKGITTVTAGIGEATENIRFIYKDGISEKKSAAFLDISDLQRLPKAFVKILKERLS